MCPFYGWLQSSCFRTLKTPHTKFERMWTDSCSLPCWFMLIIFGRALVPAFWSWASNYFVRKFSWRIQFFLVLQFSDWLQEIATILLHSLEKFEELLIEIGCFQILLQGGILINEHLLPMESWICSSISSKFNPNKALRLTKGCPLTPPVSDLMIYLTVKMFWPYFVFYRLSVLVTYHGNFS